MYSKPIVTWLVIITFCLHIISTRFVWMKGTQSNNKIYDIIHNNVPDYSKYNYTKNWYLLVFLIPFLINSTRLTYNVLGDFVVKLCLVIILRSLTICTTILPKNESCKVDELDSFHLTLGGTCYDKMFSGHFAFGLLMTLVAFKNGFLDVNFVNVIAATVVNLVHFFIIAATRSHFTMDIIVSIYATLFVVFFVDSQKTNLI